MKSILQISQSSQPSFDLLDATFAPSNEASFFFGGPLEAAIFVCVAERHQLSGLLGATVFDGCSHTRMTPRFFESKYSTITRVISGNHLKVQEKDRQILRRCSIEGYGKNHGLGLRDSRLRLNLWIDEENCKHS